MRKGKFTHQVEVCVCIDVILMSSQTVVEFHIRKCIWVYVKVKLPFIQLAKLISEGIGTHSTQHASLVTGIWGGVEEREEKGRTQQNLVFGALIFRLRLLSSGEFSRCLH